MDKNPNRRYIYDKANKITIFYPHGADIIMPKFNEEIWVTVEGCCVHIHIRPIKGDEDYVESQICTYTVCNAPISIEWSKT